MDDIKARREGYIRGYDRAFYLGMIFVALVVALFATLVVSNPLRFEYVEVDVYTRPGILADCRWLAPDGTGIDCESVYLTEYRSHALYWYSFAFQIMAYMMLSFLPAFLAFYLLFNTRRVINKIDVQMAAQKTLGLLDEEKKE